MAFSTSSYLVGVGTAFAAIAVGFAGGAMITTSAVQPPNRLERLTSSAAAVTASKPASEQSGVTTPPAQQSPAQVVAAAPSAPVIDSSSPPPPQPAAKIDVATKTDVTTNIQQPPPVARSEMTRTETKSEDAGTAKTGRASARPTTEVSREAPRSTEANREASRSAEPNKDASRKRGEDRKFSERRRRQDLDEATNIVRQMRRDNRIEEVVQQDDTPRVVDGPPRRFGLFTDDEDSPRAVNEPPPRLGLFGN